MAGAALLRGGGCAGSTCSLAANSWTLVKPKSDQSDSTGANSGVLLRNFRLPKVCFSVRNCNSMPRRGLYGWRACSTEGRPSPGTLLTKDMRHRPTWKWNGRKTTGGNGRRAAPSGQEHTTPPRRRA